MASTWFATRVLPVSLIVIGVAIGVANAIALLVANAYFPRSLMAILALLLVGVAMLVFPGARFPPGTPAAEQGRRYMAEAPVLHKAMWIVFGGVGVAAGFYALTRLGHINL